MSLIVRTAKAEDLPLLGKYWLDLRFAEATSGRFGGGNVPESSAGWETYAKKTLLGAHGILLVAETDDRHLAGFLSCKEITIPPDRKLGWVEDVYVSPGERGQGAGRALLAAVEAWARGRGLKYIEGVTGSDNFYAIRAWQSLGAQQVGVLIEKRLE
ncbi:MAG TPA: GNAT family N-acetyltransferase [Candidatus Thermoplasmatota archaeon]|nr:GNAT family N-acetyltransferase [Candidatus Thermoplasmatota archaeon]